MSNGQFGIQLIWDAAISSRAFLERVWPLWHAEGGRAPAIASTGTCGRSSLFLQRVLVEEYRISADWMTGCPFDENGQPFSAGFLSENGWQGHSWVMTQGLIIDITADQFGLATVTVLPSSDNRYQASTDLALPEFKVRRKAAIDLLWPQWQGQKAIGPTN